MICPQLGIYLHRCQKSHIYIFTNLSDLIFRKDYHIPG